MSTQDANAFLTEVGRDASIRNELRSATESDGDSLRADALVGVGAKHGYHFTMDEVRQATAGIRNAELDEAQLESVAGGTYALQFDKWINIVSYQSLVTFWAP
jgi:predicted ribosomally synthesized peptide with nif11-like leader